MCRVPYLLLILFSAACLAACLSAATAADKCSEGISLFDGKSLDGWDYFLVDPKVTMKDVWSVKDGILICKGEPMGYLATKAKFANFKLTVEWRWAPGKEPGNSGVLMRVTGKPKALPKCVEAQLKSGDAGDFWAFHGFKISGDPDRSKHVPNHKLGGDLRGVSKVQGAENPPGQWNKYEITADGDTITLVVNGKQVNKATGCDVVAGQIGLQSEGGVVHFRSVKLVPIKRNE